MSTYFVKNLHIARPDGAGTVCAGSILVFDSSVSKQQRSDVANSTLLAQLAADRRYSRSTDAENWYNEFRSVLEKIGWVCERPNLIQVPLGNSPSVDQVIMKCMADRLEPSGVEAVQTAVDAMKGLSNDDRALKIFKQQSTSENGTNFQIAHCKDSRGDVDVGLGGFIYHIGQNINNPLVPKLEGKSASAFNCFQTMRLNSGVYSHVRDAISQKLGNYTTDMVEDF
ncbi:hypothetical protein FRC08_014516 [Ceratobasidium sp. 394]|nr:hypothetical protein FRC08_014516 [Ceratobasidium sp. 394]KAG9100776.1 hypothetical protein FS749_012890 [Ceratobasidium sp. UAMH 11750]